MPSADEVKQSITNWCSSDDDLEITTDRFEPGTDFAFGLKSGTLSSSPVDLVVLKGDGADRVTIRRSLTLSGDNVSAANQLIASRPGSVTAAVERSGGDTSVVAQTYVYLDGLSKHTFVQAVAELARTSTLLDAISPEVVATDDDTVLADMPDDGTTTDSAADTAAAAEDATGGPRPGVGEAVPQSVAADVTGGPTPALGERLPRWSFRSRYRHRRWSRSHFPRRVSQRSRCSSRQPPSPQRSPRTPRSRRSSRTRLSPFRHSPCRRNRRRSRPRASGFRAIPCRRRGSAPGAHRIPPGLSSPTWRPACRSRLPRSAGPGHA